MRRRSPAREEAVIAHSLDHIRRQGVAPYRRHSSTESHPQYRSSRVQLHDDFIQAPTHPKNPIDLNQASSRPHIGTSTLSSRTPVAISSGVSCTGVERKQTAYYFRWLSVVVGSILRFFWPGSVGMVAALIKFGIRVRADGQ